MTSELEKQFFDTFGIEPNVISAPNYHWENYVMQYPQISDRILLELICLCPDLDDVFFTDVGQLKETLLNTYINIYNYYVDAEWLSDCEKELKQQVQALFKEER